MKTIFFLFLVLINLVITPVCAEEKADFSQLIMTGEAQVEQIIDPLRIRLQDQRIIQLTGIDIPDLTPYDTGDIGMTALDFLKESLLKKHIKIYQTKKKGKGRMNRMGYHLAHIAEKNSTLWIQGALIENGLARVRPSALNTEMVPQMLALEHKARQEKRGLWADEQYAILTPETAAQSLYQWAIIEGTVRANAMSKNKVYLNFGNDWRKDFTIGIPSKIRRELSKNGIDPLGYAGKTVRVRGWLEKYNGIYIELMHPVWIEVLPEPSENSKSN